MEPRCCVGSGPGDKDGDGEHLGSAAWAREKAGMVGSEEGAGEAESEALGSNIGVVTVRRGRSAAWRSL